MIKKYAINKITVTTMCVILLLIFYLLPTSPSIESNIIEKKELNPNIVYLLDNDNYVSKVIAYYDNTSIVDNIKKKIDILTNNTESLEDFYALIPKNTKLNSVKVDKNNVYLDFSKEFLNVSKYLEEKMIESIIYSLTEINGIDNIYISVSGKELNKLSDIELTYPLTRSFGINKEYNITSLDNINKTTVVFSKETNDLLYYVPITKVNNISDDKINIIIEELKSGVNSQNYLNGYINENVILNDYEIDGDEINLIFNDYFFNDSFSSVILEEVKYVVAESIFENYGVNVVIFSTKNRNNIDSIYKK